MVGRFGADDAGAVGVASSGEGGVAVLLGVGVVAEDEDFVDGDALGFVDRVA